MIIDSLYLIMHDSFFLQLTFTDFSRMLHDKCFIDMKEKKSTLEKNEKFFI
jgi:hypothetical protein